MTLYLKYRPKLIEELDLTSVRNSMMDLSNSLKTMPHAFLFSGPRGAGKTSAARILAKLINCENLVKSKVDGKEYFEPCNKCAQCTAIDTGASMDVIEMDAASNRGIDDIRGLRENVGLSPAMAKKKVYIMDEAHMLTTEAANAFLKTLEEPPSHVIFILATTDPQKLPETIHSRLSNVNFKKASKNEIERQLLRVMESEKLSLPQEITNLIIENSDGSFREAVKALEAISISDNITIDLAKEKLGLITLSDFEKFADLIAQKKGTEAVNLLQEYVDSQGSVKSLIDSLLSIYRNTLLSISGVVEANTYDLSSAQVIELIELLFESRENLKKTPYPQLALEVAIIKWSGIETVSKEVKKNSSRPKEQIKSQVLNADFDEGAWMKVLNNMRDKNASVEALLRSSKPYGVKDGVFSLGVYYRFHKERLETKELKMICEDVVSEVLGIGSVKLVCTLEEKMEQQEIRENPLTQTREEDIISAAKEIFG